MYSCGLTYDDNDDNDDNHPEGQTCWLLAACKRRQIIMECCGTSFSEANALMYPWRENIQSILLFTNGIRPCSRQSVTSVVGRLSHTGVRLVFPLGPQEFGWRSGFQGSTCLQAGCSVRVVYSGYHSLALGVVC